MDTWPFGAALKSARESYRDPDTGRPRKLSIREAARSAGISESRWRHLESGTQYRAGQASTTTTTPATAATAARVVGLDVREALELAGFNPDAYGDLDELGGTGESDRVPGFARLSPRQRQAVVEMVAAILDTDAEPTGVLPGTAPPDVAERGTVLGRVDDPEQAARRQRTGNG